MKLLLADLRAKQALYSQYGPPCSFIKAAIADGTIANALYRLQGFLARWRLAPLALIVHLVNKWLNGCVIGVRASFGAGFVLIHPVGIVINSATRGGRNVWVESSVVIGDNRGRSPVIGDDVFRSSAAYTSARAHAWAQTPWSCTTSPRGPLWSAYQRVRWLRAPRQRGPSRRPSRNSASSLTSVLTGPTVPSRKHALADL
jgi:serine O-acetyltransferase